MKNKQILFSLKFSQRKCNFNKTHINSIFHSTIHFIFKALSTRFNTLIDSNMRNGVGMYVIKNEMIRTRFIQDHSW